MLRPCPVFAQSSGQESGVGADRLSAALHQPQAMVGVQDLSWFCNPGGLCSLLRTQELPGSPSKCLRTKRQETRSEPFYQLAPSQTKMRNELLGGVCVYACVCGLKLVGKESSVLDGNIQFGPFKGMVK